MTDGFQVTISHLQEAAGKFHAEAETFKGTMPANGPAPVDGGSWVINDALSQALESIGLLHTQLSGVIENDSGGLRAAGKPVPQQMQDESSQVDKELEEVEDELKNTGRTESLLSKLLDTRIRDVNARLQGTAGDGRHVAGNTPEDLQAAADHEPGALEKLLNIGDDIPVVDVLTTAAGTAVGTYYDVKGGQSLGSALRDEAISNTAGTVAATGTTYMVGAEVGAELGSAAGPVGIAVGAVIGYGVGDLTHNLLVEPWGQDRHQYGAVLGTLYGIGHSEAATVDNARELAVGTGHDIEHYWDDIF